MNVCTSLHQYPLGHPGGILELPVFLRPGVIAGPRASLGQAGGSQTSSKKWQELVSKHLNLFVPDGHSPDVLTSLSRGPQHKCARAPTVAHFIGLHSSLVSVPTLSLCSLGPPPLTGPKFLPSIRFGGECYLQKQFMTQNLLYFPASSTGSLLSLCFFLPFSMCLQCYTVVIAYYVLGTICKWNL